MATRQEDITMRESERATGVRDEDYDIVSTLYHALQAADTAEKYIGDADQEGDQEAKQFFQEVQDHNRRIAERAKQLLTQRIS
ncbi:hypothetical protein HUS23_03570 [Ectothiorhodospiraceae bacterium 2226]|nr:hypothetical protein HUS23_03570 [Ectothiorhodospiraceae bacterium 2226]